MRKFLLTTILTGCMGATVALAIPSPGQITMTAGDFEYSNGGEFTATVAGSPSFQTFCIEIQHEFTLPGTYNYSLGQDTHGEPPVGASLVLNMGTAWLFSQFARGDILITTKTEAGEFQAALWYFQNQGVNPNGAFSGPGFLDGTPGNMYTDSALSVLGGDITLGTGAYHASDGAFGTEIIESYTINPDGSNGTPAQDWLFVPDGGTTVMLLGMGLGGLVLVSRRFAVAR